MNHQYRKEKIIETKKQLEQKFIVSSVDEVQKRVSESEESRRLSDKEYEQTMNEFFARELGLLRD
jgi:hypothetical protein